jgi:hypothetical protein
MGCGGLCERHWTVVQSVPRVQYLIKSIYRLLHFLPNITLGKNTSPHGLEPI